MFMRLLAGAALAVVAAPVAAQHTPSSGLKEATPFVLLTSGIVRGVARDGAEVYYAIPYAAPPTGDRRWAPPAPVVPWQEARTGFTPGPACLQNDEGWNRADYLRGSEDCLTVDVRTPSRSGKRPVMVWIHGGSNRAGSSSGPADSNITDQGVVTVGVQYRLGVLGFFSHPALSAEQGGTSGNYGLMDQIAALQWVRDNIARFGGDPDNVTIFGESAGSQDVSLLLAAPAAQGLFDRAILQSGTPGFGMPYRPLAEAEALGEAFARSADAAGDLPALRRLSPVALFALQKDWGEQATRGAAFVFLRTTVDGRVLPRDPHALIAANRPVPVILGTDKVEFGPGDGAIDMGEFARYWFGANGPAALAAYRAENPDPRRGDLALRLESDAQFHCPTDRLADLLAANDYPVWRYEFDVGPDGGLTSHAHEIGYVFDRKPVGGGVRMQDYWAALAIAGDPNGATAIAATRPRWHRWTVAQPRQMAFGEHRSTMEPGRPRRAVCRYATAF